MKLSGFKCLSARESGKLPSKIAPRINNSYKRKFPLTHLRVPFLHHILCLFLRELHLSHRNQDTWNQLYEKVTVNSWRKFANGKMVNSRTGSTSKRWNVRPAYKTRMCSNHFLRTVSAKWRIFISSPTWISIMHKQAQFLFYIHWSFEERLWTSPHKLVFISNLKSA